MSVSDPVADSVLRARRKKERAAEEYLEALEEALVEGKTYADLGRLLGMTRQGARKIVEKGRRP